MADYDDDPGITDEEVIWRRVPPGHVHWDSHLGRNRPMSGLFSDSGNKTPMSACRAQSYNSPDDVLGGKGYPDFMLISLSVGFLRDLGLHVASEPVNEDDPGHLWIVGNKTIEGRQKKMAKAAQWIVGPPE